jgi:hypothetical protein
MKPYLRYSALKTVRMLGNGKVSACYFAEGQGLEKHLLRVSQRTGLTSLGSNSPRECLAAKYGAPLYRVTAAMLGMDPKKLDEELGIVIRRASDWRAILLIEDADIFIQNRNNNLHRSGLISVFASHLDASDALIFMTMCGGMF